MESIQRFVCGTWKVIKLHSLTGVFVIAMLMAAVYLTRDDSRIAERPGNSRLVDNSTLAGTGAAAVGGEGEVENSSSVVESCDLFSGDWVYDNKSYPLYSATKCPFLTDTYACEKFGRTELQYQNWRWQPLDCDLPRFNGTVLLEKLRNKRIVFVGDSLGKNQWVSLICMIDSWILDPTQKIFKWRGSLINFKAIEYNVTIDFYWEPLLVESNCDDPVIHRVHDRVIRVESIENHARHWIDADILVFDSYMWWLEPKMTLLWGSFENPNRTYVESSPMKRLEMALKTWTNWLDIHLNRTKTRLFFTTLSPFHKMAYFWGGDEDKSCYNETKPILDERYIRDVKDIRMMEVVNAAMEEMKRRGLNVQVLNITQLSTYRKDAHPAIHRKYWQPPSEIELANPVQISDCVHWCLPGVPDVWNEIFYAFILHYL